MKFEFFPARRRGRLHKAWVPGPENAKSCPGSLLFIALMNVENARKIIANLTVYFRGISNFVVNKERFNTRAVVTAEGPLFL